MNGVDLAQIRRMDVLSFNSLVSSVNRVAAKQRVENMRLQQIATQGTSENLSEALKPLEDVAEIFGERKTDIERLVKDFGRGI